MKFDSQMPANLIIIIILFFISLMVRIIGIDYGYFHGDERINYAAKVLSGELVPGDHYYPPLINYLNAIGFILLFSIGIILQFWSGIAEFRMQYFEDPTAFYVAARIVMAVFGALLAPLFFLIFRTLELSLRAAFLGGLLAALFPLGVFLSHIAKGDIALATSIIVCVWTVLERYSTAHPRRWDVSLGVAIALAVSFKHSAIFLLAPMMLVHAVALSRNTSIVEMLRSASVASLTAILLWPVLNIGIVLDLQNFLQYQRIQSVMSVRDDGLVEALGMMTDQAVDLVLGVNPVLAILGIVFLAYLFSPICRLPRRGLLAGLWGAMCVGTLIVASIVGTRQPEHLWVANFSMLLLFASLVLVDLIDRKPHTTRDRLTFASGWSLAVVSLAMGLWGTGIVLQQALAKPITSQVDRLLSERFADQKIITSFGINLPQRKEAQQAEFARWDRLAQKYDVVMPELAPERIIKTSAPNAVYYFNMPSVLHGLQDVGDDDIEYEVKAHAWPLQKEEWELEYWLRQDFSIFVIRNLRYALSKKSVPLIRDFHRELVDRCEKVQAFQAHKPLFLEWPVTVFRCE